MALAADVQVLQGQGVAQAKGRAADHQDRVWMGQDGLVAQLFADQQA